MSKRDDETLLEYRLRLLRRPYSDDTTPEAQRMLNKIIREMPQEKRARRHFALNDHAREFAIGGHLSRDPGLSYRTAKLRVIRDMLGETMFDRYFAGEPDERCEQIS